MSELQQQINADLKSAMKNKDKKTLGAIRSLTGAIKQFEVDNRVDITDSDILKIVQKQVKQRKDSITQFNTAGRDDLVANEEFELEVISKYLPAQLSEEEIIIIVKTTIDEVGAKSMADMGRVMGILKSKFDGTADMGVVSTILKNNLG